MVGARDLRAFCRPPQGVPVVFNGTSTYTDGDRVYGIFDRPVQIKLMGEGIGGGEVAAPELRLPFNAFNPMPTSRDTLTVNGTDYTVYPPTTEDDGAFLCYELKAK
jgi:hypothetical protein